MSEPRHKPYAYSHLHPPPRSRTPFYSSSPHWRDVTPIPLVAGPPPTPDNPSPSPALATIAYSERYLEAMSYLRAIMARNEVSERALALTEDVIGMNPAHYTVWLYRLSVLKGLWGVDDAGAGGKKLVEVEGVDEDGGEEERKQKKMVDGVTRESEWLDAISERNLKNYQIWHHRQSLISLLPPSPSPPADEIPFLTHILSFDTKNYHVWNYRQWLCRHYPQTFLVAASPELASIEAMLDEDVYNNSAWNHRYFVVFGAEELDVLDTEAREKRGKGLTRKELLDGVGKEGARLRVDEGIVEREIEFAKGWIDLAPQNKSPWNYLRGVVRRAGRPLSSLRGFCESFVRPEGSGDAGEIDFMGDGVRSSHAIEILAEVYSDGGTAEDREIARRCWESLAGKWDPIRANYWKYLEKRMDEK